MAVVALDTSALMLPVELDIRVFEELQSQLGELELLVPEAVLTELDRLTDGDGTAARAATVGRDLADRCRIVSSDTTTTDADTALLTLAEEEVVTHVATADRALADRLLATGVPVMAPRGEGTLELIEP